MPVKQEQYIEILRGFLAICVAVEHFFPSIPISNGLALGDVFDYRIPSHEMVLVFFILSGYVIGISNSPVGVFSFKDFFIKRIIRLYPIYFICLLLAFLVHPETWEVFLSTMFFQQALLTAPPVGNSPMWSLNHEMVYYLLFGVFRYFKINPWIGFAISFFFSISPIYTPVELPFWVCSYGTGYLFWSSGLLLAWYAQKGDKTMTPQKILSWFFIFLSVRVFDPLKYLLNLNYTPINNLMKSFFIEGSLNTFHLIYLPICFITVLIFSNSVMKWEKMFVRLAYSFYTLYGIYVLVHLNTLDTYFFPGSVLVMLSLLVFFLPAIPQVVSLFNFFGKVSYGLYLVHVPLLIAIDKIFSEHYVNGIITSIYIIVYLTGCTFLAYLLEIKFQYYVGSYLKKWWLNTPVQLKN